MSRPKKTNKDKATMLGWSSRWNDGGIGWRTSTFVADHQTRGGLDLHQREASRGSIPYERVRITVEVVRRKDGRKIVTRSVPI